MKVFEVLPSNYFSILVSKNKDIYIDALFVLRDAFKNEMSISKENIISRLIASMEDEIKYADFTDDEVNDFYEDNASSKAHFILRKLKNTGWIDFESQPNTFEENIVVPSYSSDFIELLHSLVNDKKIEYDSYVYTTYVMLKNVKSSNAIDEVKKGIDNAYTNTQKLLYSMKSLYNSLGLYHKKLSLKENINDILKEHFVDYKALSDEIIYPLITRDSIPRYKGPIIDLIDEIFLDKERLEKAIRYNAETDLHYNKKYNDKKYYNEKYNAEKYNNEEYNNEKYNNEKYNNEKYDAEKYDAEKYNNEKYDKEKYNEVENEIYGELDFIKDTYTTLEEYVYHIQNKNNDYVRASTNRINYLLTSDKEIKGKIINLLRNSKSDNISEKMIDAVNLVRQEYYTESSIYIRENKDARKQGEPLKLEKMQKVSSEEMSNFINNIKDKYSNKIIKEYMEKLFDNKPYINSSEFVLNTEDDLIMLIMATVKSDKQFYYVEFTKEMIENNGYTIPNMRFIRRENVVR